MSSRTPHASSPTARSPHGCSGRPSRTAPRDRRSDRPTRPGRSPGRTPSRRGPAADPWLAQGKASVRSRRVTARRDRSATGAARAGPGAGSETPPPGSRPGHTPPRQSGRLGHRLVTGNGACAVERGSGPARLARESPGQRRSLRPPAPGRHTIEPPFKLVTGVRFPSPAPARSRRSAVQTPYPAKRGFSTSASVCGCLLTSHGLATAWRRLNTPTQSQPKRRAGTRTKPR